MSNVKMESGAGRCAVMRFLELCARVDSAAARRKSADADLLQAQKDVESAEAEVRAAEAALARSRCLLQEARRAARESSNRAQEEAKTYAEAKLAAADAEVRLDRHLAVAGLVRHALRQSSNSENPIISSSSALNREIKAALRIPPLKTASAI